MDTKDERKQETINNKKNTSEQPMGEKTAAAAKPVQNESVSGTGTSATEKKKSADKLDRMSLKFLKKGKKKSAAKEGVNPSEFSKKESEQSSEKVKKHSADKGDKPIKPLKKTAAELLRESNRAVCDARNLFEDVKTRNTRFLEEVLQVLSTAKVKRGYYEGNNGSRPLPRDTAPSGWKKTDGTKDVKVGFCLSSKRSKEILQTYADRAQELCLLLTDYIAHQNEVEQTILSILYRLSELETGRLKQKEAALQKKEREIAIYQTLLAETLQIQGQDSKKKNLIGQIEQFQIASNTLVVIRNICDIWGGSEDLQYGKYMLDKIKIALTDYEKELEENKNGGFGD